MADTDDWGGVAVESQPKADDWGGIPVGTAMSPKMPDMSAVRTTANDNLKIPEGEETPENEQFGPKLDRAAGMPVTSALGSKDNDVSFTPQMRGHLADAYKNKSAVDAGDFMQSAVPSIAASANPDRVKMFPWQDQIDSFLGHSDKMAQTFFKLNKDLVASMAYYLADDNTRSDMEQMGMVDKPGVDVKSPGDPTLAEATNAFTKQWKGTMGKVTGAAFSPVIALTEPIVEPAMKAIVEKAKRDGVPAEEAETIPGIIGVVLDAVGFHAMTKGHAAVTPELQELVGDKLKKPAEQVTKNDIAAAIRMGFEDNAPKAKEFDDAAALIVGPENETKGAETLINVWSETGVPPSEVHADVQADPAIGEAIKKGEVPEVYKEKAAKTGTAKPDMYKETEAKLIEEGRGISEDDESLKHIKTAVNGGTEEGNVAAIKWAMENGRKDIADHIIEGAKRDATASKASEKKGPTISEDNPKYEEAKVALKQVTKDANERYKQFANLAKLTEEKTAIEKTVEKPTKKVTKEEHDQILERSDLSPEHQGIEENLGTPETMTASQLGKVDAKIGSIFANDGKNGLPKASELTDEEFRALEDYGRRVEAARDSLKASTPAKQIKKIFSDEDGTAQIPENVKEFGNDIKRELLNFATPMETGTVRSQASAKRFANTVRKAKSRGIRLFNVLGEDFAKEDLMKMWEALDEASDKAREFESEGKDRADAISKAFSESDTYQSLPEEQRKIDDALTDWASDAWSRAKKAELTESEGLAIWTPRMAAMIGEDGTFGSPPSKGAGRFGKVGKNLRTTASSLKHRKYVTSEETEAAIKESFGEDAVLVKDIRTQVLALTRLEEAIAGRTLINEIKEMGKNTGAETVVDSARDGYFTLDHPAFRTYRPRLTKDEAGKWSVTKDENGKPIFDSKPLYVSKEFEGPLKAVLSQDNGLIYKSLMSMKGTVMSLIMYSPLIHNGVEWGRALPAMPGKVASLRIYFEGNAFRHGIEYQGVGSHIAKWWRNELKEAASNPAMDDLLDWGYTPIGHRFHRQELSSIMEMPSLKPGVTLPAKLLGAPADLMGKAVGDAVRSGADKAVDFYQNDLLWNRVADLQAGIALNMRADMIKDGVHPAVANAFAAHFANRFAGALPKESMGHWATKIANVVLFSRTFKFGNFGIMKDALRGLPSDTMAQLEEFLGKETLTNELNKADAKVTKLAKRAAIAHAARRIAFGAVMVDIAMNYVGNSILQDVVDHLNRDKSLDQIMQGYVYRYHKLLQKHGGSPWELLDIPNDLKEMSSTASHEPGKENRILWDTDPKTGTDTYLRFPFGKIGEEFEGWIRHPSQMMHRAEGTFIKPLLDIYNNSDWSHHPIYNERAKGLSGMMDTLGKVVTHIMEAQVPKEAIESAMKLLEKESSNPSLDKMKIFGPMAGVTASSGYPGGPEAGILADTERRQSEEVSAALPDVKKAVEKGDEEKAREIMGKLNMTDRQQQSIINHYRNPAGKVNSRNLGKFERTATPEEKELMGEQQ